MTGADGDDIAFARYIKRVQCRILGHYYGLHGYYEDVDTYHLEEGEHRDEAKDVRTCTIVEVCQRCGEERRFPTFLLEVAKDRGVPSKEVFEDA